MCTSRLLASSVECVLVDVMLHASCHARHATRHATLAWRKHSPCCGSTYLLNVRWCALLLLLVCSPLESVCLLIKGMAASHEALKSAAAATGPAAGGHSLSAHDGGVHPIDNRLSKGTSHSVAAILKQCLSPPSPAAVDSAVTLLRQIGALDVQEALTALGHHLKQMPMDPRQAVVQLVLDGVADLLLLECCSSSGPCS